MKTCMTLAMLLTAIALSGCGTPVHKQAENIYPSARTDAALIYFFRPSVITGNAVNFTLMEGETTIGGLRSGSYFFLWTDPGTHTFSATSYGKTVEHSIQAEAGRVYYVKSELVAGIITPHLEFHDVPETEGATAVQKCDYVLLK